MRLYGRGAGYHSQARVTTGFRSVLEANGLLDGFYDLDVLEPSPEGASSNVALFTGPLSLLFKMQLNAAHQMYQVMVAPNSSEIGKWGTEVLEQHATELLTPSHWAKQVLERHVSLPVRVVMHGLEDAFASPLKEEMDPAPHYRERFTVLHLSSTDFQRKGTRELVQAWQLAYSSKQLPKGSTLLLVLEEGAMGSLAFEFPQLREHRINVVGRLGPMGMGLPTADMVALYQSAHLVAQPSRGEGFGMVPLEARAAGTPVLATACTGHSAHVSEKTPAVVVVPHYDDAPIDDLPGAMAPRIEVDDVRAALVRAYEDWENLAMAARAHRQHVHECWNWTAVLAAWIGQELQR